ncbi:DUF2997 domain-containing protein [Sulfurovum sp. bin170]|uniref:DUF2997 domain-containing protein n=1 Tax=Sulfurovum sp. bin170 TaxID=2695268 RepID=UPI0013DEF187|nr:DUF2997 domain-containing protein [Sulfurovum sp. bin170]NEW60231.1 DUF2997 domain-containing protein [Sulfurovum sp. bin170]
MKDYKIEITIDKDGNIKAETKGMEGKICITELDEILAGLEGERKEKNKPEYYKKQKIVTKQQIKK